jgi:hypothetical protein
VDFRSTMNQPTVDSTEDDVVETSHDAKVNVNIVTLTKKVTKKKATKVTTALKPPKTKEKTRVKVTRRLCHLCHEQAALEQVQLPCKVCNFNFCRMSEGKGLMVIPFFVPCASAKYVMSVLPNVKGVGKDNAMTASSQDF